MYRVLSSVSSIETISGVINKYDAESHQRMFAGADARIKTYTMDGLREMLSGDDQEKKDEVGNTFIFWYLLRSALTGKEMVVYPSKK